MFVAGIETTSCSWRGVLDITLCDKVYQLFSTGRWFSSGTPVSMTNKTDLLNLAEILLKVAMLFSRQNFKPEEHVGVLIGKQF
jgi:hypothetical protein